MSEPLPINGAKSCPLKRWRKNVERYPLMKIAVMKLFSTPATSVPSECVFSTAGDIVNNKRNCLLPKNVDMLVFMYKNKHMIS